MYEKLKSILDEYKSKIQKNTDSFKLAHHFILLILFYYKTKDKDNDDYASINRTLPELGYDEAIPHDGPYSDFKNKIKEYVISNILSPDTLIDCYYFIMEHYYYNNVTDKDGKQKSIYFTNIDYIHNVKKELNLQDNHKIINPFAGCGKLFLELRSSNSKIEYHAIESDDNVYKFLKISKFIMDNIVKNNNINISIKRDHFYSFEKTSFKGDILFADPNLNAQEHDKFLKDIANQKFSQIFIFSNTLQNNKKTHSNFKANYRSLLHSIICDNDQGVKRLYIFCDSDKQHTIKTLDGSVSEVLDKRWDFKRNSSVNTKNGLKEYLNIQKEIDALQQSIQTKQRAIEHIIFSSFVN